MLRYACPALEARLCVVPPTDRLRSSNAWTEFQAWPSFMRPLTDADRTIKKIRFLKRRRSGMPNKLRWKWIVIGVVLLSCVLGVTELPKSKEELLANWGKNIRLGLDLK